MKRFNLFLLFTLLPFSILALPSIKEYTSDMKKYEGFFPFYWNEENGKVYLEVNRWEEEFLALGSLAAGVGSNDIGLDRGQLGQERVVAFQHIGNKALLVQPNYRYRANSDNEFEKRAVEEAFAQSVIAGFQAVAQTDKAVLVDFTSFLMTDHHGVAQTLKRKRQGSYTLDSKRSAMYLARTKNFPKNSEWEMTLTFGGSPTGSHIYSVAPEAKAVTVRQHYSFVELPDDNYTPRKADPRAGFFQMSYMDFAQPLTSPIKQRFIIRHRLNKKNPNSTSSPAVEPIIYYLDPGTPEPIRSALMEGASWWNEAFESAGFQNAFQVKVLPKDADPMDVRYNVIQWVHRSTRGWSYGASVVDPRTGEIIKGHVTLGSLRVRQDFLLASGLMAAYEEGQPLPPELEAMALARLRQLAAHEVGHTIGLAHNFAASTNSRASVMDYPHPYITLQNGKMDFSQAYDTGIGEWDKITVAYGYGQYGNNEEMLLQDLLHQAFKDGYRYITDSDARASGGAHPYAHLWDNGASAVTELNRLLELRKFALANFSPKQIPVGAPMATLEEVLVPIYLMHRYQLEAVSKVIGGLEYSYAVRGDEQEVWKVLPRKEQEEALKSLLQALSPEQLQIPKHILPLIPPRPPGYNRSRETFQSKQGKAFDPLYAASTVINLGISQLLHEERATRLYWQKTQDPKQLGLAETVTQLLEFCWGGSPQNSSQSAIQAELQGQSLRACLKLAYAADLPFGAKIAVQDALTQWAATLETKEGISPAAIRWAQQQLDGAEEFDSEKAPQMPSITTPDGSPIGCY